MADGIRATPRQNQILGLLADRLKQAQQFGAKPFGYENPPVEMLMNLLGVPAVQQTLERMSYGEPLTTGRGMTTQVRPEAIEAAMTLLPMAAGAAKATKGLPVGASIKDVGKKLKVKPPTDDVYEVMDSTFDFAKLGGNKTLPIEQLTGGVRMNDPKEIKRVKDLAEKISSPDGYVSRIIVDDLGNVLEGQHRLEALRLLGEKNVPVAVIENLANKYDIPAMKKALEGKFRSDEARQLLKHSIDALEESGSVEKALIDFEMPAKYQAPFQDAIKASTLKSSYPQEEALRLAQQRASLPVEQGGLGLPVGNTAEQRAAAMGFDVDLLHGTAKDFPAFDLSKAGTNTRQIGDELGIFSTSKPFLANSYAEIASKGGWANRTEPTGSVIYPLKANLQSPKKFERATDFYREADPRAAEQSLGNWRSELQNQGFDSVIVRPDLEEVVAFNPEQLRSRFAAFDPFRKTAATAALMGVATPDLLAQETPQLSQEEIQYLYGLLGQ